MGILRGRDDGVLQRWETSTRFTEFFKVAV
jgi:hypothetical protein